MSLAQKIIRRMKSWFRKPAEPQDPHAYVIVGLKRGPGSRRGGAGGAGTAAKAECIWTAAVRVIPQFTVANLVDLSGSDSSHVRSSTRNLLTRVSG